jgi:hypothetical protein
MTTVQLLDAATLLLVSSWDMEPAEFDERLAAFLAESADKLAAMRAVVRAAQAQGAAHKAEAAMHLGRVRAANSTTERIAEMACALLRARREIGESTTIAGVVRLQVNGGLVPLVYAAGFDPALLPAELRRVRYEADAEAIRDALARGEAVPGVTLGERGESVRWAQEPSR